MSADFQDPLPGNSLPTNAFPTNPLVGYSARKSRRRFLRGVLTGAAVAVGTAVVGSVAGFPGNVIASGYADPSGTSPAQVGSLEVGRMKVATENFAKFTVRERDQTHALFNNTWATPNEPHTAMIAAMSSANTFDAHLTWNWPNPPSGQPIHAYHAIYHGLDTAAGICTDSRYPFQVSQHSSLRLDIPNVTVSGGGGWGLAFDLFLFKQQPFSLQNVQSEIFIVLKRQAYDVPPEDATLSSCGVTYGHGRWSPSSNVHAFWRKDNPNVPFRQTIDIYDFVNFLKTRGFAADTNILTTTDLGVEPVVGSGVFTVDSFYVTLT